MSKFSMQTVTIFTLALLAGCGAPNPASYGSNWKPVHAYTPQVQKTPLVIPHVYKAHPSDVSLRGLLTRWSKEAGVSLDYASGYEFTLVAHVDVIQDQSLGDALKELHAIYHPHGAEIAWKRNTSTITVRDVATSESKPSAKGSKSK